MRRVSKAAAIRALTAFPEDARFRAAAKWFAHRTSLTRFLDLTALRAWKRFAARCVERSLSPTLASSGTGSGIIRQNQGKFTHSSSAGVRLLQERNRFGSG